MPTVLITGGHSGIGFVAAETLASQYKMNLILAGRNLAVVEKSAKEIQEKYAVKVTALEMDLSSLASVRQAADEVRTMVKTSRVDSLQAILCNAGGRWEELSYNSDGYEVTFATNHLGHFLLVNLLLDTVSSDSRIVFTASGTHDPERIDGKMVGKAEEPDARMLAHSGKDGVKEISAGKRYATSKLCNIMTAYELNRRLQLNKSSISSIAFDPGVVSGTGFLRGMPKPVQWLSKTTFFARINKMMGATMGSLSFSGTSLAKIAVDTAYNLQSGKYFESNDGLLIESKSSKKSYDLKRSAKLWEDSERLVYLLDSERPQSLATASV
ncbi:MAG: SDR family NAD(P)-dependent oxidoreductase [Spirochaetales bacterium]|nr:SDR family NAD(P)-dependent oxidoreductase [Spirochaetales bacterium]